MFIIPSIASAYDESNMVGIWAMEPLRNGIANVVDFNDMHESNLFSFMCNAEKEVLIQALLKKSTYNPMRSVIDVENT